MRLDMCLRCHSDSAQGGPVKQSLLLKKEKAVEYRPCYYWFSRGCAAIRCTGTQPAGKRPYRHTEYPCTFRSLYPSARPRFSSTGRRHCKSDGEAGRDKFGANRIQFVRALGAWFNEFGEDAFGNIRDTCWNADVVITNFLGVAERRLSEEMRNGYIFALGNNCNKCSYLLLCCQATWTQQALLGIYRRFIRSAGSSFRFSGKTKS
jgi:hypothetical protein